MSEEYLIHYGVKGMKWGVRRYQNPDGTLTAAGKKRAKKSENRVEKAISESKSKHYGKTKNDRLDKEMLDEVTSSKSKWTDSSQKKTAKDVNKMLTKKLDDLDKNQKALEKKLSEIDTKTESYRSVKKRINSLMGEHSAESDRIEKAYQEEYKQYYEKHKNALFF